MDPPLDKLGSVLAKKHVKPNDVTIFGFIIGMLAVPLIALQYYKLALAAILVNRFLDGIDGAVARHSSQTHAGGYLDIVLDFIFYSAVVFGFALASHEQAIYSAFLIFSFIGTGTTFLAFAIFAQKLDISSSHQGKKSFYYLAGLAEGFETIAALVLMCLLPQYFWIIALVFGTICWISTVARIVMGVSVLRGYDG
jgi:phosphatidylglycerophosphate synthase